jgi:hypothetical protein
VRPALLLFRLVGPWNGNHPRPASTPRSDTIDWATHGATDGDAVSRVIFSLWLWSIGVYPLLLNNPVFMLLQSGLEKNWFVIILLAM